MITTPTVPQQKKECSRLIEADFSLVGSDSTMGLITTSMMPPPQPIMNTEIVSASRVLDMIRGSMPRLTIPRKLNTWARTAEAL
jgi:hypothetical protein